jgi:hypothetical protein
MGAGMNIASPQAHSAQLRDGNKQSASVPNFLRDLCIIGEHYRQASADYNKALDACRTSDANDCVTALIAMRANLSKVNTLAQSLQSKLMFALEDRWEDCREVYR